MRVKAPLCGAEPILRMLVLLGKIVKNKKVIYMEVFKVSYDENEEEFLILANGVGSKTIHPEHVADKLWRWLKRKE